MKFPGWRRRRDLFAAKNHQNISPVRGDIFHAQKVSRARREGFSELNLS
jgi:hypothetical protein